MTAGPLTLWLAAHPRVRRAVMAMSMTYVLALAAVVFAPRAAAATGAAVLSWTGLHDTDNVPIAYYFVSLVSVREAATNNGEGLSLNPETFAKWVSAAMESAMANVTAALWLGFFAGMFMFIMGAALWFLRFALSTQWLVMIATFAGPLFVAVTSLANRLWLGAIAITVCVAVAGYHMQRGQAGRGWAMIGTAVALTILQGTVFRDPIGDLYSDHGLLAMGRGTGFEIAQSATGAPFARGESLDQQLDALMAQVVTAGVRHPIQLLNFGRVIDDVGGCGHAWSAAIMASQGVDGPGPAHAMQTCGAPQALAHAQHLGGSDISIALVFVAASIVVGFFFWYVGLSVMVVGLKALYFGLLVGPVFLIGTAGFGRAARFAKHCGTELFMHVVQLMVFEVFLAVSAMGISWVLTTSRLGTSSLTTVPRILLMTILGIGLLLLFRFIDRSFHTDSLGTIGRQIHGAWHAGTGVVRQPYADARAHGERVHRWGQRGREWAGQKLGGRQSGEGDGDDSGTAKTRTLPGFDVFKPRASSSRRQGREANASQDSAATRSTAGSHAREAAGAGVKAAVRTVAPEIALPAEVAANVAGRTAKRRKERREGARSPSQVTATEASASRGERRSADPVREPAQTSTLSTRPAGRPPTSARRSRSAGTQARTGQDRGRADQYDRQPDAASKQPPQSPREIG